MCLGVDGLGYLEGQGDFVSLLLTLITYAVTPEITMINLHLTLQVGFGLQGFQGCWSESEANGSRCMEVIR